MKLKKSMIFLFAVFLGFSGISYAGNMAVNGDFEADANGAKPSSWTGYGLSSPATYFVTTENAYTGAKSAKLVDNNTSVSYIYQISTVTPSGSYTLSTYFLDNDSNTSGTVSIYWYSTTDGSGSSISSYESAATSDNPAWQLISLTKDAPSNANSCKIRVNIKNSGASTYSVLVDSVTFNETTAGGSGPNYTLSLDPSNINVPGGGGDVPVTVNVVGTGGFGDFVTLSLTGLPSGVTGAFDTNPADSSSELTVTVANTIAQGSYSFNVVGSSDAGAPNKTAAVTLTVGSTAGTGASGNLVSNGDFETDSEGSKPTGWTTSSLSTLPATSYVTAEKAYAGSKSFKMTDSNTTASYIYQVSTVTAGTTYTLAAYIFDNDSKTAGSLQIYWYTTQTASGSSISNIESGETSDNASWQLLSLPAVAPATANSCKVRVNINNSESLAHSIYVDSITFVIGAGSGGTTTTGGTISAKITEVAPSISKGDFVELFITADSNNVSSCTVCEGDTVIKTLPYDTGALKKNSFIIIWENQKNDPTVARGYGRDETYKDENGNGWIDLYSDESSPGLTGTDNNITLKNANGTIVDFMSFADDSATYSGSSTAYDSAVTAGQWYDRVTTGQRSDADYIDGSFAWDGSTSKSMYRVAENGQPKDTNKKADWMEGAPTPGYGDYGSATVTSKTLQVFDSVFSPYGDGTKKKAQISYFVPAGSQITIRVFDITGRAVRVLVDHQSGGGASNTVGWDGKDDDGNIVRTGIYIVNIESINTATGEVKRSSQRVVVGRKMK